VLDYLVQRIPFHWKKKGFSELLSRHWIAEVQLLKKLLLVAFPFHFGFSVHFLTIIAIHLHTDGF